MKYMNKVIGVFCCFMAVVLSLHFLGHDAFAAEKSSNWRPMYDLILRYINFGIIVFLIIKYGKTPIMNFLRGQKEKLAKEIKRLEDEKEDVASQVKEMIKTIDESEERFEELKERIVQQGEKKKVAIIQTAQAQSESMIVNAKQRIESHFLQAKNDFRAELIDNAIDLALERFPKEMSPEDNENFTRDFLTSTATE
ncbi:MAG: ATP synthase F0 subunit B [Deltaproteobacteria bacterium]|nr:ATP synthase F0 subunit B [Deltaproteobacteria bacterium]MBW2326103.1 ATP synthase F0 subunit B [Deltaproteobacteria bacterium]